MEPEVSREEAVRRSFMRTFSKRNFYPLEMKPQDIFYADINHALANLCRYGGHSHFFYSVAQHVVLGTRQALEDPAYGLEVAWNFLHHDDEEAYIVDLPTPIKRLMPEYGKAAARVSAAVAVRFNLDCSPAMAAKVHEIDMRMLATEARQLMGNPKDWAALEGVEPFHITIEYWDPPTAKQKLYDMFQRVLMEKYL